MTLSDVACGGGLPKPQVVRMVYSPPRPENCAIEVVNIPAAELGPMNPQYDMLGSIVLTHSESGGDPFDPRRLAIVRPEVCKLGGEKVSLGINAGANGYTTTAYSVIKAKGGASGTAPTTSATPTPP